MKKALIITALALTTTSFVQLPGLGSLSSYAVAQSPQQLVGTWAGKGMSDGRASQTITLELRGDGTYTKTLDSVVDGHHYGGTHSGTWRSEGSNVYLSGDGNWPAYTQDLRYLHKVS